MIWTSHSPFVNHPVSIIGMEACGSAHHWARELTKLGHEVILLNARYVKSFVVGNKNDFNDAAAIYDAVSWPNKRVVAIKTVAQQDIQLVHSLRKELVDRTEKGSGYFLFGVCRCNALKSHIGLTLRSTGARL